VSEYAAALVALQAELPTILKNEKAEVPTKNGGSYSYTYADLASISDQIRPLLGKHGFAFSSRPTINDAGRFVLAYALIHKSGERDGGDYPLVEQGGPQAQGSAITYARRYALCAVVGVAPEDDDGQAAQTAATAPTVDLAPLQEWIDAAQDRGLDGDWDKTRRYAAQSPGHLVQAIKKLRERVEGSPVVAEGDGKPPAPATGGTTGDDR
jgi:hypothetical protein